MSTNGQIIPIYGEKLLSGLPSEYFRSCIVFCAPEAWALVERDFPERPLVVTAPVSMEQSLLEAQIQKLPSAETIFGIGGGSACDAAKLAAWIRKGRLILLPSIISVDAAYTSAVGVRVDHHVRYVGKAFPEKLLIDFDLLAASPKRLNQAGVGDVLSIATALFDWKLAAEAVGDSYDSEIAQESAGLLENLFSTANDIAECNRNGLTAISELYVREVALCERFGSSRPEEGSEHYVAYCLESITKKSYIHGELVCLSILLTALHQGQDVFRLLDFMKRCGVAYSPEDVGVSEDELRRTLIDLPAFLAREKQLPYGIYHHTGMDSEMADKLLKRFYALLQT